MAEFRKLTDIVGKKTAQNESRNWCQPLRLNIMILGLYKINTPEFKMNKIETDTREMNS